LVKATKESIQERIKLLILESGVDIVNVKLNILENSVNSKLIKLVKMEQRLALNLENAYAKKKLKDHHQLLHLKED